jgi:hypothetical protein
VGIRLKGVPPNDSSAVKGMMKIYINQTNIYDWSTVMIELKDKDQAAGLEIAELSILYGHQA